MPAPSIKLVWHPRPDIRGQVWQASYGTTRLMVRRLEEGGTKFGGVINELIMGEFETPMNAMTGVEAILRDRIKRQHETEHDRLS